MCFGPQRRALFRHLNFRKWPEHSVFCTFWLRNVLRATTACTFSTSQPLKVLQSWNALYILTSKCASRHNGVHFFDIAASTRAPKLRRFVHFDFEICFAHFRATAACNFASLIWPHGSALAALASLLVDPPGHKSLEKHSISRLFYLFTHLRLLSSDFSLFWSSFFCSSLLWPFPPLFFHLSILSEVWPLNFLRRRLCKNHHYHPSSSIIVHYPCRSDHFLGNPGFSVAVVVTCSSLCGHWGLRAKCLSCFNHVLEGTLHTMQVWPWLSITVWHVKK